MLSSVKNRLNLLQALFRIYKFSKPARDFTKGKMSDPVLLQIQTVSACNGRCLFCPYPVTSKSLPQGKMDWNTYRKIVDECVSFPSLRMFTPMLQNEPLLDKNISRAISYFKEKNGGRVPVFIVTNGYLLTTSLIKELVDTGLDQLIISLNAHTKETYEELMPGFKFENIRANIENLLSSDLRQTKVTLRFLENQKNKDEISEARTYWQKKGARTEILSFISNRADMVDISKLNSDKPGMMSGTKIKQKVFSYFSKCCILPFYQMNILFNGDVLLCCHDWRRAPILGNVNQEKLADIWFGKKAMNLREKISIKDYNLIEACKGCSVTDYFESWG